MKQILLLSIAFSILACGSTGNIATNSVVGQNYGYNASHPILVGGQDLKSGPEYERNYLNNLSGPNGEVITYTRTGSCCQFKTPNGFMGGGMLDKYELNYEGLEKPVIIYLNMYDPAPGEIKAPKGLQLKKN
ncbi:2-dehydro-3-deoxyphosphooctonate aldolase [Zunongwangia sp. F363]|uniref:2-dehydro-3-deoxyphosphooctonate aldolase n=1 Tax=Autumnicola tepida TaxID=3075595 RepID=A0ABU3CCD2_9FLAO|nr:2-dehydro-3-deoxyphosphooctonate aldolase [Zunongwangia sp. F363]MDT0643976.1 2-dehydro-3-deoxyphosphooctonate aldolase [Zunongwangia sp. F363]